MLELVKLRKVYSGIPVVEVVSFTARAGEITGYLGANGSGKSTTRADRGTAYLLQQF